MIINWLILGVLAFLLISFLILRPDYLKYKNDMLKAQQHVDQLKNLTIQQQYYIGDKCIGLSPRKGYEKFSIAGVCHRNLPVSMVGKFNGYAIAETDNKYIPYTISIYNDEDIHLGFLKKRNKALHSYIIRENGKVHAYGYLAWNDSGMYGETCVEVNKNLVTKRNKAYAIN